MVAYVYDKILSQGVRAGNLPGRTQDARKWFRDTAQTTRTTPESIMRGDKSRFTNRTALGRMYMFYYDPKHKKTLKTYDTFPLIFPIKRESDGFIGMNFHYLGLKERAVLMDALYDLTNNDRYDEKTKLVATYELLNKSAKYKYFKPTVHRYLSAHVRSRFLEVSAAEWDIALFLPVERFEKQSKRTVFADSRKSWQ